MNVRFANLLSTIGHPLLTIPFFVMVLLFNYESAQKALIISALVLGAVIIPLSVIMYKGSKNGTYTNFDVSDKNERQNWYSIVLLLLLIPALILFFTNQQQVIKWHVLCFFLLLLTSKLLNYYIKSSLHVSLNIFLTFLIMPFNTILGTSFFIFVLFVSWSRIVLKMHSIKEVIYGCMVGLLIGLLSWAGVSGYAQQILGYSK